MVKPFPASIIAYLIMFSYESVISTFSTGFFYLTTFSCFFTGDLDTFLIFDSLTVDFFYLTSFALTSLTSLTGFLDLLLVFTFFLIYDSVYLSADSVLFLFLLSTSLVFSVFLSFLTSLTLSAEAPLVFLIALATTLAFLD